MSPVPMCSLIAMFSSLTMGSSSRRLNTLSWGNGDLTPHSGDVG